MEGLVENNRVFNKLYYDDGDWELLNTKCQKKQQKALDKWQQLKSISPCKLTIVQSSCQYDMQYFGILLYYLCVGEHIVKMNIKEKIEDEGLCIIKAWDKSIKYQ